MTGDARRAWTDARLAYNYLQLDRIAETLTSGSDEYNLVREAMGKLELADRYIEERKREEMDHNGCSICGLALGSFHRENCEIGEEQGVVE